MHVQETFINRDLNACFGATDPYEAFTDDVGRLFRACQREYGQCTGSVYIDGKNGQVHRIGWVFRKRDTYTNSPDTYLREVWVTLLEGPPKLKFRYHHLN